MTKAHKVWLGLAAVSAATLMYGAHAQKKVVEVASASALVVTGFAYLISSRGGGE